MRPRSAGLSDSRCIVHPAMSCSTSTTSRCKAAVTRQRWTSEGRRASGTPSRSATSTHAATGSRRSSRRVVSRPATASRSACPTAWRSSICGSRWSSWAPSSCPSTCSIGDAKSRTSSATPLRPPLSRRPIARPTSRPACACWTVDALEADAATAPAVRPSARADAATPVALIYTSGTTGVAKGAVLTHGNFAANALSLLAAWGITSADRYFAALPLFHVHGLGNGIQCWLASGCHMRLVERFEHEQACDWFEDVPAHAVLRRADDVRAFARNRRRSAPARSASACDCSSPARRRCRRRCTRTLPRSSGT